MTNTDTSEDRGPGRPEIGGRVNIRLGDLVEAVDKWAERAGLSRADAVRKLVERALALDLPRYVVTYRDASGFEWEPLDDERYDTSGDVLIARDRLLNDEPEWLPRGRHRAVDLETGQILDWEDAYTDN